MQPPASQGPASPDWQRWKDTPGAAGHHIPSDDYLQRLSGAPDPFHPPPTQPQTPSREGPQKSPFISDPLGSGQGAAQSGPGHYTMVSKGLSNDPRLAAPGAGRPKSPAPAATGPAPSPGPTKKSKIGTILALVAVLLAIVAVVVILILTS